MERFYPRTIPDSFEVTKLKVSYGQFSSNSIEMETLESKMNKHHIKHRAIIPVTTFSHLICVAPFHHSEMHVVADPRF
ncbi:hypothetical protein H5410_034757 [Solanum commersonii]|uniref:Uncharacterized protein n=1 Tax=Solanum commersonii TaxID=4109 RepID=A0A9J5YRJ9_SOLCO|nr:hypothetical protein H5410_034757 [Solanum commersonii]